MAKLAVNLQGGSQVFLGYGSRGGLVGGRAEGLARRLCQGSGRGLMRTVLWEEEGMKGRL